jgi:hypothetical protein
MNGMQFLTAVQVPFPFNVARVALSFRNCPIASDDFCMTLLAFYVQLKVWLMIETESIMFDRLFRHPVAGITSGDSFTHASILEMAHKTSHVIDRHVCIGLILVLHDPIVARTAPQLLTAQRFLEVYFVVEYYVIAVCCTSLQKPFVMAVRRKTAFIAHV